MRLRISAALAAFLACGASLAARAEVTVTFLHYQAGDNYKSFRRILDGFESANPGIKVKDVFSQSEQITADLQAALAARRPIDIATVIGKNIVFFLNNTPAVPLDEDPAAQVWLSQYLPNFLEIGRVEGKIYAIPHAYGTPMLYYNRDLFRQAGLDPEKAPATWPEAIRMARTIQDKTGVAGIGHLQASMKDYGTMLMVTNAGSPYLSKDGSCALFDTPQGISALQMWRDMVVTEKVSPVANDRQMQDAFNGGRVAMWINSSAGLAGSVAAAKGKFELGVARYPLFVESQPRHVPNSGAALMLYAPRGERREASLKLLAYLSRREVSNGWARESGYMPLARDPLADPAMADYVASFPLVRPVIDQMADTVPTATWGERGVLEAQTEVSNLLDALWAGKGSAAQLVPPAVARMNSAMGCRRS